MSGYCKRVLCDNVLCRSFYSVDFHTTSSCTRDWRRNRLDGKSELPAYEREGRRERQIRGRSGAVCVVLDQSHRRIGEEGDHKAGHRRHNSDREIPGQRQDGSVDPSVCVLRLARGHDDLRGHHERVCLHWRGGAERCQHTTHTRNVQRDQEQSLVHPIYVSLDILSDPVSQQIHHSSVMCRLVQEPRPSQHL